MTASERGIGDGHLRGEAGVRGDQLAVRGERASAGLAVQVREHEGVTAWPEMPWTLRLGERPLDQRLDVVEAVLGGAPEQDRRVAAEPPVGARDFAASCADSTRPTRAGRRARLEGGRSSVR